MTAVTCWRCQRRLAEVCDRGKGGQEPIPGRPIPGRWDCTGVGGREKRSQDGRKDSRIVGWKEEVRKKEYRKERDGESFY